MVNETLINRFMFESLRNPNIIGNHMNHTIIKSNIKPETYKEIMKDYYLFKKVIRHKNMIDINTIYLSNDNDISTILSIRKSEVEKMDNIRLKSVEDIIDVFIYELNNCHQEKYYSGDFSQTTIILEKTNYIDIVFQNLDILITKIHQISNSNLVEIRTVNRDDALRLGYLKPLDLICFKLERRGKKIKKLRYISKEFRRLMEKTNEFS